MILTEGEKMLVTPTYHVFEMYKVHQDATLVPVHLRSPMYEFEGEKIEALQASASRDDRGRLHLSLCNLNPNQPLPVNCRLRGFDGKRASGRVLTADAMNAHNTFDRPDAVRPAEFTDFKLDGDELSAELPAKSVVVLAIEG